MKLLYINYWGIHDTLTEATVFPNLRILAPYFSEIHLATVERYTKEKKTNIPAGIIHVPFSSSTRLPKILGKIYDLIFFCITLFFLVKRKKMDLIICRGSMAAIFGFFLHRVTRLPFIVESFEPHSEYMAEGNTWKRNGIQYKFQKWSETQTMKHAQYVMPVTHNYADYLIEKGVRQEKILVMPCCVDIGKFSFNEESRLIIRNRLGIKDNAVVGIYVGKFGDIYLKEEAFTVFSEASVFFGDDFFLIILSPQDKAEILENLDSVNIPRNKIYIDSVLHDKVPEFLSAADFAYSLIRTSPSRKYCSPVKNGEYWANGLPVLLTKGVGDDEKIIQQTRAGTIVDIEQNSIKPSFITIQELLHQGRFELSNKISPLAKKYRDFEIIADGYKKILMHYSEKRHLK